MTETKAATVAKIDPTHYNRVVSHATIRDIRLIGSKFELKPDAVEMADRVWTFNRSQHLDDWTCDNEKGTLTGIYTYSAACVEGRRKLLSVTGTYVSSYALSDLCDEQACKQFLDRVGRFAAYPYFRSLFAALTQQSGIMLPPLPVMSDGPRWVNSPADVEKLAKPKARKRADASSTPED